MPVTRKRKVEAARLAGFGLVLAGVLTLVLAVLSAQNAGPTTSTDMSRAPPMHQCGCNTTTTEATTTTESSTTTTASTTTISSTTPTTMGGSTGPIVTQGGGPTGPVTTAAVGGPGGVTGAGGVTGGGGSPTVVAGAEAAQQLPFTGSSSFPLAAIGIVFILCGGGLALRKRRLAR